MNRMDSYSPSIVTDIEVSAQALQDDARSTSMLDVVAAHSMLNVLTIDLEDWFHVTNFEGVIRREDWSICPSRLQYSVPRLLDLLDEFQARATFFTLGWVARQCPELIKRIQARGHELASHGDDHQLVTQQSAAEFEAQLHRSCDTIEQLTGQPVKGYRAPSYSFRKSTEWVIPILLERGLEYDSSIFPLGARRDSRLCDSRFPCWIQNHGSGTLAEYPLSTARWAGMNVPIAGGGYFRLLPYNLVSRGVQALNRQGHRAVMYLHPWELDPGQPKVTQAPWLARFRHYHQLHRTEQKLRCLLREFRFGSIRDVFWSPRSNSYDIVPQR